MNAEPCCCIVDLDIAGVLDAGEENPGGLICVNDDDDKRRHRYMAS